MAKKIGEAGAKKECPSCGLGVAPDSMICEFCGWNFDEEDEWILQIEKLERELMQEKQKFEPGSVDQKIEASLHTPAPRRASTAPPVSEEVPPAEEPAAARPLKVRRVTAPAESGQDRPPIAASETEKATAVSETIEIENARIRTVRGAEEPEPPEKEMPVRHVRTAAAAPEPAAPAGAGGKKSRKVRVVRKVKD